MIFCSDGNHFKTDVAEIKEEPPEDFGCDEISLKMADDRSYQQIIDSLQSELDEEEKLINRQIDINIECDGKRHALQLELAEAKKEIERLTLLCLNGLSLGHPHGDIVIELQQANIKGISPPQNWTTRAIAETRFLRARIAELEGKLEKAERKNKVLNESLSSALEEIAGIRTHS